MDIPYMIPQDAFKRASDLLKNNGGKKDTVLALLADMCRVNVLTMIVHASSGHIGASFSILDFLTALYYHWMNHDPRNPLKKDRDRLILSKGHAVVAQYALLAAQGYFPIERLADFRSFKGLQGHPDITNTGIDANTGSLGMGLSKGKGMVFANRIDNIPSSVYVVLGDGELAEGQNWEALQNAAAYGLKELVPIIDRNQFQTDSPVSEIMDMGKIEEKLRCFGWDSIVIDGHDFKQLCFAFEEIRKRDKPVAVILHTTKGKGVSFMEGKLDTWSEKHPYHWHGRCPNEKELREALKEIYTRIDRYTAELNIERIPVIDTPSLFHTENKNASLAARVTTGFAEKLLELGGQIEDMVVLDADLERDCLLDEFHRAYPGRFFQIGIAEQDMVSTAGGLAREGKIPVVNSYTAFLTSRANEQIFNNSSEKSHIIYIGHFAGLLPAKPGKSHLGIRDVALLKNIPNMLMIEPLNAHQAALAFEYLVRNHTGPGYLRLRNIQAEKEVTLPDDYLLKLGEGVTLRQGKDILVTVSCPVLTLEVLEAAQKMEEEGVSVGVVHLPWLNNISLSYMKNICRQVRLLVTVENHMVQGGVGDEIASLVSEHFPGIYHKKIGITEYGQSGATKDILRHYQLDSEGIRAQTIDCYQKICVTGRKGC